MARWRPTHLGVYLLLMPALLWLGLLIILPHANLFVLSFSERQSDGSLTWSLSHYRSFFSEPLYWRTFFRTGLMSVLVTVLTLLLAFPLAWHIAKRARGAARGASMAMVLLPFWASEMVRTLGWMILLRGNGVLPQLLSTLGFTQEPIELLYNDAAMTLGLVYSALLFMVVPLINTLDTLDDSLIEAAYDLGGTRWSIIRQIIIPHAAPGIAAGTIMVFMLTLGNYLAPVLLGGKNSMWFTEQIYTQFITRFNWEQGSAFAFLLLVLSSTLVWLGLRLTGQQFSEAMRTT